MYLRFLNREYFQAFKEEFQGFEMAGMTIDVQLAETELPIVPKGRRRRELGHPRYYADVWNFPEESERAGIEP